MKIRDITILNEAPISDYATIGDFERNSSIRDPRDRFLITNPQTIERVKSKFANTHHKFNLYFLNMPKATAHKEIGEVSIDWVREKLGDDVADKIAVENDAITVLFTNNSGAQRVPMTAWIMAHRIGHALMRVDGLGQMGNSSHPMTRAFDTLVQYTQYILTTGYGLRSTLPSKTSALMMGSREDQLLFKNFWMSIATFKSARDRKMRDWFEINNELIAQYITTGRVKFVDQLPQVFKHKNSRILLLDDEYAVSESETTLEFLGNVMDDEYNRVLSHASGKIYVM